MISVEHLTKRYGDFTAVDDLSFEIEDGHVYGFLGPNGAGKSTTMNIMTGCLSLSEGSVKIEGHDIFTEPNEAKRLIGYLPEQPPLYMNETPYEYLSFVAEAKGVKKEEREKEIERVMEKTKITDVSFKRIASLSKGYKQRVGIAQALLGNPKMIILDEPTVGLDPLQIVEIRDLIRELGKEHTVIFSSHILSEVQAMCDLILMISKGKLMAFGSPEELEKQAKGSNEILFTTEASKEETEEILHELSFKHEYTLQEADGHVSVQLQLQDAEYEAAVRELFFAFAKREKVLFSLQHKQASLEELFIELTSVTEEEKNVSSNEA